VLWPDVGIQKDNMSTINKGTAADAGTAKQAIEQRIRAGTPAPAAPKRLPVASIETVPALFQPRSGGERESESHVIGLARAIGNAQGEAGRAKLTPVVIFWVGNAWACLDGHHRLAAITATPRGKAGTIAVEVFTGSLAGAMLEATARNSQNKLAMSEPDKSERAWKLLLLGSGTHAAIAGACGTSTKTMQRMAAAIKEWKGKPDGLETVMQLQWWQARKHADGGDPDAPYDGDAVRAAKVDRQRESLGKVIKDNTPGIVGDALLLLNPELAKALMDHFRNHFDNESIFEPIRGADWVPFPSGSASEF